MDPEQSTNKHLVSHALMPLKYTNLFLHIIELSLKRLNTVDGHTQSHWFALRDIRILTRKLRIGGKKSASKSEEIKQKLRFTRWRIERYGFEPWPGSLCCVLGQDTLLS